MSRAPAQPRSIRYGVEFNVLAKHVVTRVDKAD